MNKKLTVFTCPITENIQILDIFLVTKTTLGHYRQGNLSVTWIVPVQFKYSIFSKMYIKLIIYYVE